MLKYENMKISSTSENNMIVEVNEKKKLSDEAIQIKENCHSKALKTKDIIVEKNGFIFLSKFFKYLGFFISYDLSDECDINLCESKHGCVKYFGK